MITEKSILEEVAQLLLEKFRPTVTLISADPANNQATFCISIPRLVPDSAFFGAGALTDGSLAIRNARGVMMAIISPVGGNSWVVADTSAFPYASVLRNSKEGAMRVAVSQLDERTPNWRDIAVVPGARG